MLVSVSCGNAKLFRFARFCAVFSVAARGWSAWAQTSPVACQISLGYSRVAPPPPLTTTSVPSLTVVGVGILAMTVGIAAWKYGGKSSGKKMLSALLVTGASIAMFSGGDSMITAVRAAGAYVFDNSAGGAVTDANILFANPSPLITVTNTSGSPIKITSNGNTSESGTCTVGAEIPAGGACTTQAVCPVVTPIQIAVEPTFACDTTTPLDIFTWLSAASADTVTVFDYAPIVDTAPTFNPAMGSITTAFSYLRTATQPVLDVNGEVSNGADLGAGVITLTATAPQGYGFGTELAPTKTWSSPYSCQTMVSNSGGGGSGGNN